MKLSPEMTRRVLELADAQTVSKASVAEPTEAEFQADVVKLAKRNGWRAFHCHDSRKSEAGFPDLVLVRERVIVAELKVGTNRLTAEQANWLESFRAAGVPAFEWRPADWSEIDRLLSGEAGSAGG